jgi:hypothetical protein
MKKCSLILFFIINFLFLKADLDQQFLKSVYSIEDGRSFQQFEDEFRNKYSKLNIPEIKLLDGRFGLSYHIYDHFIALFRPYINGSDCDASKMEWCLLHEVGHSQKPNFSKSINLGAIFSGILMPFLWGKHKTKPYKNIVTKISSKTLAGISASVIFFCAARKLEERRADNFANQHADEKALVRGLEYFESIKKSENVAFEKIKTYSFFLGMALAPFKWGDPIHPTINSRIAKIKTALKTRFGVDA